MAGAKRVRIFLKAATKPIMVGGYKVETENYNGAYVPPIVEARPGDIVAAHLENDLRDRAPSSMSMMEMGGNPTNLHYFHGGVVSPKNARKDNDPSDSAASAGNGDNVYVNLPNGGAQFEYDVQIPKELDARVLEGNGKIPYPSGLNWYHAHLHMRSSDQVMGGLSGLISVGDPKANVIGCATEGGAKPGTCKIDAATTKKLQDRTVVRYALLRDIALKNISALPSDASAAAKSADWAPEDKNWNATDDGIEWSAVRGNCGVWTRADGPQNIDPKLRLGYCQRAAKKAWLFTLNGQRFPTITVEGGKNLLLRLGNLSSNVTHWLELVNAADEKQSKPFQILSVDGVVPGATVMGDDEKDRVLAAPLNDLVLLPASRTELYIRNDCSHPEPQTFILRSKGLTAGPQNPFSDVWPEVRLATIVLQPSAVDCKEQIALNAAVSKLQLNNLVAELTGPASQTFAKPKGCADDIDPTKREHRRVVFLDTGKTTDGRNFKWSIKTEIRRPKDGATTPAPYDGVNFPFDEAKEVAIDDADQEDGKGGVPFEEYVLPDGKVDWNRENPRHACIFVDKDHKGSHKQLWVLDNQTAALHNFHIHQMKFRLATAEELGRDYLIDVTGEQAHSCPDPSSGCKPPDFKLFETSAAPDENKWHDTIPMPAGFRVYVIMSFDAPEQIGRFVYHCHILKHEDAGLMAPIEVWSRPNLKPL